MCVCVSVCVSYTSIRMLSDSQNSEKNKDSNDRLVQVSFLILFKRSLIFKVKLCSNNETSNRWLYQDFLKPESV